jgi:selenocysteine lyase/cysteine desulfurase
MIGLAKAAGAITVIDGAQGVVLARPDLQTLGADFYVFSGHKLYGPTGIGVLYGRYELLSLLKPLCFGGEMIKSVSFSGTTLNQLPYRLEAGTPNIAGAIGLAAAMCWLNNFDTAALAAHKQQLFTELYQGCLTIKGLELLSAQQHNAGILALNVKGEHPTDVAALLNEQKIAVRAGTHCAMPLFQALQRPGAVRLSLAAYNNSQDIKHTLQALEQTVELLQ